MTDSNKNEKTLEKSDTCDKQTFVFDSKEVVKTGRTAIKRVKARRAGYDEVIQLIEVCPVSMVGINSTFNVWVTESELYHILDEEIE